MENITRRTFAAAALATAALSSTAAIAEEVAPIAVAETVDCDIVVVGAGISGLAATVQAAQLGLNTLCIESAAFPGGNGIGTEGILAIGSKYQKELGIEITPADIIAAELEESQWRGDGSLWLNVCENSAQNIDWLEECGVLFSGHVDNYYTGLFSTMHWFQEGLGTMGGACYVDPMVAAAQAAGATVRCNTRGYKLIQAEDGSVCGLYAKNTETDEDIQVNAKAVVIAAGGPGINPELLKKQGWQQYNIDNLIPMCMPSVVGDGYLMAMAAGAADYLPYSCDQAFIGIKAVGTDTTAPYSSALNGGNGIAGSGTALWINQDGNRFNNEAITHVNMAAPEAACCRFNREAYAIFDQALVDAAITDPEDLAILEAAVEGNAHADSIVRCDTLEELAENFGMDAENLKAQVERYNAHCAAGYDSDFGKDPQFLVAIQNPPFYMARLVPLFVVIIGGIQTNVRAEVLGNDLYAIPGLYAAGLDGAMLHRNVYTQNMPGSNMANNVNSGRNAAMNAKAYIEGLA